MSALSVNPTFPIFTDIDGSPLENGYIWIGATNLNPQTSPITAYWDAALTIPATQPIRTLGGYPSNNGTPGRLYVDVTSSYSILVQNKNGSLIYSAPVATEREIANNISYTPGPNSLLTATDVQAALDQLSDDEDGSSYVGFLQAGTNAAPTTVQAKLRETVSVKDFGAVGNGVADDTAAFIAAAATGKPLWMPQGDYLISQPVTIQSGLFGAGAGDANTAGKTKITLTGSGQLIVGDWYCQWDGFEVRSAINNKTLIVNPGKSYWTFTNFVVNKIGAATGQIGIEFNTSSASIYFNRLDNINIRCDYPVRITGNSTQVFNANKIGMGVGGNKWFDFLSAITVESGVLACDANEFGGYFESGVNMLTFDGVALRQNRFRLIMDLVTRIWNSTVAVTDANLWEILDGGFTFQGTYPQNQVFIGPPTTKVRATNSVADNIPNSSATVLTFDAETYDTLSEFSNGTGIFTAKNAGYYQVDASALSSSVAWDVGERWEIRVYKNGVEYAKGDWNVAEAATTRQRSSRVVTTVYMNGSTDTLDVRVIHNQGGTVALDTAPTGNYIDITRLQ